jgi:hypothetical protein
MPAGRAPQSETMMARTGVTQEQIDAAADALLKDGERPKIERVRAVLGTGLAEHNGQAPGRLVVAVGQAVGREGAPTRTA